MKRNSIFLFIAIALVVLFTGCPSQVLQSPNFSSSSSSSESGSSVASVTSWGAPQDVTASNGYQGRIELSWTAVKGAAKYNIYEADTAYTSSFTKRAETTDTSYSLTDCSAGDDKYYIVKAVKKSGTESSASLKVHGSSLAQPFINYIGEGDTSYSENVVYWAMENVSSYQNSVRYNVYCYDAETGGNLINTIAVDGSVTDSTTATFTGLSQNTTYWYYVEAYNVNEPDNIENSGARVDETTTRKTTPNAVTDLTATEGTDLSEITLTFKLPEACDVLVGTSTYETYPLYFKIYRQVLTKVDGVWVSEDDYVLMDTFYGENTVDNTGNITAYGYYSQYTPVNVDEPYEVGQEITWTDDTSLSSSNHYKYKIVSYADYSARVIVGNEAAYAEGFLASVPALSASITTSTVDADDSTKYSSIKVTCAVSDIAEGYYADDATAKFYLGTMVTSLDGTSTDYSYEQLTFTAATYNKVYEYDDLSNEQGYYKYRLFVYSAEASITDGTAFDSVPSENLLGYVQAAGQILVYATIARPDATSFTVTNGYSDKILMTWDAEDGITYTVKYLASGSDSEVTVWEDGAASGDATVTGEDGDLTLTATGIKGAYTLYATDESTSVTDSNSIEAYTLGTASVSTVSRDYENIKIAFAPVTGASSYEISYVSPEDDSTVVSVDISDGFIYNEGKYNFTIPDIAGYDNPLISGKDVEIDVKATSNIVKLSGQGGGTSTSLGTTDSTTGELTSNTLGPACSSMTTTVASAYNKITVTFQTVDGASYYYLFRERLAMTGNEPSYENVTCTDGVYSSDYVPSNSLDGYIIDLSGSTPSITDINNSFDSDYVSVNVSGTTVTVVELIAQQPTDTTPTTWEKNQDRMAWGYPYRYLAFPITNVLHVYNPATRQIINFNTDDIILAYNYSDDPDSIMERGSTIGYGTDVSATKSTDPRKVTISYTIPYGASAIDPYLYRREWTSDNSEDYEQTSDVGTAGTTSFTVTLSGTERVKPFEYAVRYHTSGSLYTSYIEALEDDLMDDSEDEENYAAYTDPDTQVTTYEPQNKGYAFAISMTATNVAASDGNEGYSEKVGFTHWDYSTRAIGPDDTSVYDIQIKNLNCSADYATYGAYAGDWFTVAQIDQDGELTKCNCGYSTPNDGVNPDSSVNVWATRCFLTATANSVTLAPTFGSNWWNTTTDPSTLTYTETDDGWTIYNSDSTATTSTMQYPVHYGLLRVLRDYKHYYRVHITRNINDEDIYASYADNDDATYSTFMNYVNSGNAIYTYRKITPQELCQSVGLIIANSLYNTGIPKAGTSGWKNTSITGASSTLTGNSAGNFMIYHKAWDNYSKWESSTYQHIFWNGVGPESYTETSTTGSTDSNIIGVTTNQDARTVYYPTDTSYRMNSPWSIAIASSSGGRANDLTLYGLEATTMNVEHEANLPSYEGSIYMMIGRQTSHGSDHNDLLQIYHTSTLSITDTSSMNLIYNEPAGSEVSSGSTVGDTSAFLKWFPYKLGVKHESATAVYDDSLQVFQYAWWSGNSGDESGSGEISSQQW